MAQISATFRRQHKTLLLLSAELKTALAAAPTKEQASNCANLLSKINGVLSVHLAAEDKSLYPRLMAANDQAIALLAKQFSDEMGGLAGVYDDFQRRWSSSTKIYDDFSAFRGEAESVLQALGERIAREERELYPLADRQAV